ncbi:hypothetical protein O7632_28570 [Solwaraspora sp. WMMD406]|uniref:hypothetical protein n=1 Tax=Solwaraspora sp. WMMD406 TaxID=3016095 RepID=UPI002417F9E1|nr:hypothetical protein [Solwaraspora sp. WMMD406]MDG4768017.1 hypothetical protein [Solwaraspora sp. WMMD406]
MAVTADDTEHNVQHLLIFDPVNGELLAHELVKLTEPRQVQVYNLIHRLNGHSFPNHFTANGSNRAVNGVGAAIENQQLCLNGKSSGYHCDAVYQLNHCNGSRCGLVATPLG